MLQQVPRNTAVKKDTETPVSAKLKEKSSAIEFTAEEIDLLLDDASVTQELQNMYRRGVAPSQVEADVTEVIRWQERLQSDLDEMSKATPGGVPRPWVTDLIEDLIAYEVSPAHSTTETLTLLDGLEHSFIDLENSGFGPEARNYIASLRAELQILVEKIHNSPKS
jgi:hypothetical protein